MSIAANKFKGIRAAVVSDCFSAKATREHNNTNVLCLGERVIGKGLAMRIVEEWLNSSYNGERHARRLQMIDDIEKKIYKYIIYNKGNVMSIICASIMCADQMKLKEELEALEEAGVKLLHCDVMDGIFVKNLAMGPELLKSISENTTIPLDIHLATETPDKYIDMMSYIKPKYISFHVESSTNKS